MSPLADLEDYTLTMLGGKFWGTLNKAGVPDDFNWRAFLSHLRSVRGYPHLTNVQKEQAQELLLRILSEKIYTEEKYNEASQAFTSIINAPFERKLQATMQESMALIDDVKGMMGRRTTDVSNAAEQAVSCIEGGGDPAKVIARVRSSFRDLITRMEQDTSTLEAMILNDGLTNITNRRGFDLFLADAVKQWEKDNIPLALIMFDIDHFKKFNDTHGHRIGDQAIKVVAQHTKRISDKYSDASTKLMPARYGGEEFALVVLGRRARDAAAIAEDLRGVIGRFSFIIRDPDGSVLESNIHITVSLGVSMPWKNWSGAFTENLVDSADKALYFAKRGGRNRVAMYTPEQETQYTIFEPGA